MHGALSFYGDINLSQFYDLSGRKYNRVTLLSRHTQNHVTPNGTSFPRYNCLCECGTHFVTVGYHVKSGNTKSCGCWNRERKTKHGLYHTYFQRAYRNAKSRCTNPNTPHYSYYGGRGIEFRFTSVPQLAAELGPRPTPQHSIDRIDNSGHYEPGNVRWATKREQSKNQRPYRITTARLTQLAKMRAAKAARAEQQRKRAA